MRNTKALTSIMNVLGKYVSIKKILGSVAMLFIGMSAFAQQDVQFTQYMHNKVTINPAYAGTHEVISATALFRKQWVSMPGAPSTQSFNIHSPLKNEKVGVGMAVINDQIGITNNLNLYGEYSYKVILDDDHDLHFGLQGGLTNYRSDFTKLEGELKDDDDVKFDGSQASGLLPNFGFGMYYYSPHYYVGFSVPQIVNNTVTNNGTQVAQQARHYFVTAGFVYTIHENWKIRPAFMMKATSGAPIEVDISNNFIYKDKFWIGLAYRTGDSFDLMAMIQATEQFSIGYAYDYTLTDLGAFNSGSHEIVANYRFSFSKGKMITPRYF